MADIILTVRLGISDNAKNKKMVLAFANWLNQKYDEYAQVFIHDILESAQVPFDGDITTMPSHNLENDVYDEFHHPKHEKGGKWFLWAESIKFVQSFWKIFLEVQIPQKNEDFYE